MVYVNNVVNPLVTCIITSYQKIPYLFEAIDSVLNQTYSNIELIIADDGSDNFNTEEMVNYIQQKKRNNIQNSIVCHQAINVGTVENIRKALQQAHGYYCINLDGDDVLDHDSVISEMIEFMQTNQIDLLECGKIRCDENLNAIEVLPTSSERRRICRLDTAKKQYHSFAAFRFLNIGGGSGMAYIRESYEQNGLFNTAYRNWQDGPSLLAYVQRDKMIPINHDIIAIKYRAGGVSNSPKKNNDAIVHIGEDRMKYISTVTIPDRWNPYVLRRRRFMFYYYIENAKTKWEKAKLLLRFPFMSSRLLVKSFLKRKRNNL